MAAVTCGVRVCSQLRLHLRVLALANFLVSCEVGKVVLQESWDLDGTPGPGTAAVCTPMSLRSQTGQVMSMSHEEGRPPRPVPGASSFEKLLRVTAPSGCVGLEGGPSPCCKPPAASGLETPGDAEQARCLPGRKTVGAEAPPNRAPALPGHHAPEAGCQATRKRQKPLAIN